MSCKQNRELLAQLPLTQFRGTDPLGRHHSWLFLRESQGGRSYLRFLRKSYPMNDIAPVVLPLFEPDPHTQQDQLSARGSPGLDIRWRFLQIQKGIR